MLSLTSCSSMWQRNVFHVLQPRGGSFSGVGVDVGDALHGKCATENWTTALANKAHHENW